METRASLDESLSCEHGFPCLRPLKMFSPS